MAEINQQGHVAVGGVIAAWASWFIAHVGQFNQVLQFFVLLIGTVSGVYAVRYYRKQLRK